MAVILGDIVRVVNRGTDPLTIGWANKSYTLHPDKDTFVPVEAAWCWFGDWRSGDNIFSFVMDDGSKGFVPDRATEVRRLRLLYGNHMGNENIIEQHPDVEVYDVEGGRMITVIDDPAGKSTSISTQTVQEQESLRSLLAKQSQEIETLRRLVQVDDTVHSRHESAEDIIEPEEDGEFDPRTRLVGYDKLPEDES